MPIIYNFGYLIISDYMHHFFMIVETAKLFKTGTVKTGSLSNIKVVKLSYNQSNELVQQIK